jgi:hypothetical protein
MFISKRRLEVPHAGHELAPGDKLIRAGSLLIRAGSLLIRAGSLLICDV